MATATIDSQDRIGRLDVPEASKALEAVAILTAGHAEFGEMIRSGAAPTEALTRLGTQLFQQQRFAEAAPIFSMAVPLAPRNSTAWTNYGTALDANGQFAKACAALEQSLALNAQQPDTWLLLGLVRKKLGDFDGCEAAYRTAIELAPESAAAWQCLGLLKNEDKNYSAAIECLSKALELGAADAAVVANLAKLYYEVGRYAEAREMYERAVMKDGANAHYRQMLNKSQFLLDMIRGSSAQKAWGDYQNSQEAGETEEDQTHLLQAALGQLSGFGHVESARRLGALCLKLRPNDEVAGYLIKALDGEAQVDRSPAAYVAKYYDAFAKDFDEKLVNVLGYDAPEKLFSAICAITPANHRYEAADVGCGTGLCGPLLRDISKNLVGVDLAPKMLEQAAKRKAYDELICDEVTAFLARSRGRFDLVVAADVIIYIGNLASFFESASTAIRPGGLLAFSTERWMGEGFKLLPTGRFSHNAQYIRSLADPRFEECVCAETPIRLEASERVPGHLFVFRREN